MLDSARKAEIIKEYALKQGDTGSAEVQVIGKTILLFRANPDRDDEQKIKLP